jgi:hypothetical protein
MLLQPAGTYKPINHRNIKPHQSINNHQFHAQRSKSLAFASMLSPKHACKGQRLATLSMKLMVVYALMRFDITMVDGQGRLLLNELDSASLLWATSRRIIPIRKGKTVDLFARLVAQRSDAESSSLRSSLPCCYSQPGLTSYAVMRQVAESFQSGRGRRLIFLPCPSTIVISNRIRA